MTTGTKDVYKQKVAKSEHYWGGIQGLECHSKEEWLEINPCATFEEAVPISNKTTKQETLSENPTSPLLINNIYKKPAVKSEASTKSVQSNESATEHIEQDSSYTESPQSVYKGSIDWGDVRAFIDDNAGKVITFDQLDREFGITTKVDKKVRRQLIWRLCKDGKAEKLGAGKFRLYDEIIQEFNPGRVENLQPIDMTLPLGLSDHIQLFKGNAIAYAGTSDAGKSLLAIETVKLNLEKFNWHYWWSETGAEEFYIRAKDYLGLPHKNFHLYERDENFVDCIRRYPDDCHICDYVGRLEGEWNLLGSDIAKMISALKGGFLLINLQSNPLTGHAFGGVETMHRVRLFLKLTLDNYSGITKVSVEKAKTPKRTGHSIRGHTCNFQPMPAGVGVEQTTGWERGE